MLFDLQVVQKYVNIHTCVNFFINTKKLVIHSYPDNNLFGKKIKKQILCAVISKNKVLKSLIKEVKSAKTIKY